MPKKQATENTKKAAGMAKKAESAAAKQAAKDKATAAAEASKWEQGSKDNKKADAAASKAAEAARKKAERDALLREEEASQPSKPKGAGSKAAQKKKNTARAPPPTNSLDNALASLDQPSSSAAAAAMLNASGIDNALDALSLTGGTQDRIDRHPERRFPAAYKAFEERRLDEMKDDKGLRRQQKVDLIRKEFEKHPDNPFNQVSATYNTSKAEMLDIREAERKKTEARLGSP